MTNIPSAPSFLRRLAAMLYDGFLLLAVWFIAISLGMVVIWLVTGDTEFTNNSLSFIFLELTTFFFYGWFWTHGGQTLGMRAWRMKVIKENGEIPGWSQALVRYLYAHLSWMLLGVGFLMVLFNKNRMALHDNLSHTYLQMIEKKT